jgi:hypothetical protein
MLPEYVCEVGEFFEVWGCVLSEGGAAFAVFGRGWELLG